MALADHSDVIALLRGLKDQEEDLRAEDLCKVIYSVADASKRQGLADRAMNYAAAMKDGGADQKKSYARTFLLILPSV